MSLPLNSSSKISHAFFSICASIILLVIVSPPPPPTHLAKEQTMFGHPFAQNIITLSTPPQLK